MSQTLLNKNYNGISTSTIHKTTLQYEWSTDKVGNIKELEQKATVRAMKIESHYDAKKNITTIKESLGGIEDESIHGDDKNKEIKVTLSGLVVVGIKTEKGSLMVDYQ